MGRYRLGPVYWGSDAGAYVPLAREQDKKANPELHFHRPQESIERIFSDLHQTSFLKK